MRVIFEEVDREYFFEIILDYKDFEKFETLGGIIGDFVWESDDVRDINVYIRKEKENEQCHWLKEKRLQAEKDSAKTSSVKCTQASRKSKPLRSRTRKRAKVKKKQQPRKRNKHERLGARKS